MALWDLQLQAGGLWDESSTWEQFEVFIGKRPSFLDKVDAITYLSQDLVALEELKVTVLNLLGNNLEEVVLQKGERIDLSEHQGVVILKFETNAGTVFARKVSRI